MEKRIKEMVEAIEGKKKTKGRRYVDPEEYKKLTGMEPEEYQAEEEEEEEEEPRKGKLFGRGLSIAIAIKAKKAKESKE